MSSIRTDATLTERVLTLKELMALEFEEDGTIIPSSLPLRLQPASIPDNETEDHSSIVSRYPE